MAYGFNDDKSRYELTDLIEAVYPVGSIYMSVNDVNPGDIFGGTWVEWGNGKVPVGVDTTDTNFNAIEKTGGTASNTHTAKSATVSLSSTTASGTNGAADGRVKTIFDEIKTIIKQKHSADISTYTAAGTTNFLKTATLSNGAHTHTVDAHTNLQPYITCYMWKRTA